MANYSGFYSLAPDEDPKTLGQYVKRSDGAVVVPSADALSPDGGERGVPVELTNYAQLTKSPDYSQLVSAKNTEDMMAKAQELKKKAAEEPVQENPTRPSESRPQEQVPSPEGSQSSRIPGTPLNDKVHEIVWDTPMGQFATAYRYVLKSTTCLILINKIGDKPKLTPVKSTKENPIIYTLTYRGVQYNGIYLGASASDETLEAVTIHLTK